MIALIVFLGSAALLMLAIGLVVLLRSSQQKLERKHREQMQQEENYQRQLLEAMLRTQENEQQRISRDLHDGIAPAISIVQMQLGLMADNVGRDEQQLQNIRAMQQTLRDVVSTVRVLSHEMMPTVLESMGLYRALEGLVTTQARATGINIALRINFYQADRLEQPMELSLYRILQELLHNSLKHAHAQDILIYLKKEGGQLVLEYRDDGAGFEVQNVLKKADGMGLKNIDSRVRMLKGTMQIASAPGEGFLCRVLVPLHKPEAGAKATTFQFGQAVA